MKAPGLYHVDTGLSNAPTSSLKFRSVEMGQEGRFSQIAMPWDADHMFFRRYENSVWSGWLEIAHSENIGSFTQAALDLRHHQPAQLSQELLQLMERFQLMER